MRPPARASRRTPDRRSTCLPSRFAPRAGSGRVAGCRSLLLYFARPMSVSARYYTDPACPWSWSAEPAVRKLMVEFGDNVSWTYVMGGLARDYTRTPGGQEAMLAHWLDVADRGTMPIDPRLWRDAAISSSYPACMAVK